MNKTLEIIELEAEIEDLERMKVEVEETLYHYSKKQEEMEIALRDTNKLLERKYLFLRKSINNN